MTDSMMAAQIRWAERNLNGMIDKAREKGLRVEVGLHTSGGGASPAVSSVRVVEITRAGDKQL